MTRINSLTVNIPADSDVARELAKHAEKHDSLTRNPPKCPRCGRVLTRWKRGTTDRIVRAECNGCGWYR